MYDKRMIKEDGDDVEVTIEDFEEVGARIERKKEPQFSHQRRRVF